MDIDNTRANAFRTCPWMYYEMFERNGNGVQPIPVKGEGYGALELGGRVHELLEIVYKNKKGIDPVLYPNNENEKLEGEARWMVEAYRAHYPNDNWEIIDVERTFRVQLPQSHHVYVGKIDLFIRDRDTGLYWIIDHKTEKRGSKSHIPQKLGVTDQGSLYLWAACKVYNNPEIGMKYNMLTRPSPAGREGPSFPERYEIERGQHEIDIAVRDITLVADDIEAYISRFKDNEWPADRQNCYGWGYCDFYLLHRYGEDVTEILKHKFEKRDEYLSLEGVEVTQ